MNIKDFVRIAYRLFHLIFWMIVGYLAGDSGMGFYFISFIIFQLFFVIFIGGIKETVARMVANRINKGFQASTNNIFRFGMLISAGAGIVFGLLFWFSSSKILTLIIGTGLPSSVLGFFGLYYIIFALVSCMMGFCQGKGDILPCLIAEIVQGIILVGMSPIVIKKMYAYGSKVGALIKNGLYANINGALGAVLVQIVAAFIALIILTVGLIINRDNDDYDSRRSFKRSFILSCFYNSFNTIIATLALLTIAASFIKSGYAISASGKELFTSVGVFAGKFLLTISFPFIFFVDYVEKEKRRIRVDYKREEYGNVHSRSGFILKNMLFMMVPVCASVIVLAKPIVMIFFGGKMSLGVTLVRQGGIVTIFIAVAYTCKAVLSAIDRDYYAIIADIVAYVAMVVFLSATLKGGLNISYLVYAFVIFYFIQAGISFYFVLSSRSGVNIIDVGMKGAKVIIGTVIMIMVQAVLDKLLVMNVLYLALTLVASMIVYYVVLAMLRGITRKDINSLNGTFSFYPASFVGSYFNGNR